MDDDDVGVVTGAEAVGFTTHQTAGGEFGQPDALGLVVNIGTFEAAVSEMADVGVDVVGAQTEDAVGEQVTVVCLLQLDGLQDHGSDLVGGDLGALFEDGQDQVHSELQARSRRGRSSRLGTRSLRSRLIDGFPTGWHPYLHNTPDNICTTLSAPRAEVLIAQRGSGYQQRALAVEQEPPSLRCLRCCGGDAGRLIFPDLLRDGC